MLILNAIAALTMHLPARAVVLTTYENLVTISKGSKDGYKKNMIVIVLRGRVLRGRGEQIAAGKVDEVHDHIAIVRFERFLKAPQPGDTAIPFCTSEAVGTATTGPREIEGTGAGDEIRTRDPLVGNEMLYH